ncbi:MAG: aldehyde dehydrogenase family protein [Planctomycetota bacterium]
MNGEHDGGWARLRERLGWVRGFRRRLAEAEPEITALMGEEIGKPRFEGLTADVMPVLAAARFTERHASKILRTAKRGGSPLLGMGQTHRVHRLPLGRVAIIATWNYPVGLLGVQLVQALAAGNSVVVKPSEVSPRTQSALLDLAEQGLPLGVLTRTEATREAGEALLREHRFDHVVFTGSTSVGRAIAEALAPTLTPSTLELSGRDTALVLEDAPIPLAARSVWMAATANGGQTCMAPKRVLVRREVYADFLRALGSVGAGARPRRLASEAAAAAAWRQVRAALEDGARTLSAVPEPPEGAWIRPEAVVDCPESACLVEGRNFAPVFAVLPVDDLGHALRIHAGCDQHLATSVYTRRVRWAESELAPRLQAGTVTVNDAVIPTAHPGVPLAGLGESGWGVSRGVEGLLAMTRPLHTAATSRIVRPPLDEPSPQRLGQLAGFVRRLYRR